MKPFNEFHDAAYWQAKRNEQREIYITATKAEYACGAFVVLAFMFLIWCLTIV